MRIFTCPMCNKTQEYSKRGPLPRYCVECRPKFCVFPGCDRTLFAKELCGAHYRQQNDGLALSPIVVSFPLGHPDRPRCVGPDCDRVVAWKDLCVTHNQQQLKGIPPVPVNYEDNCLLCGEFRPLNSDHDHKCCTAKKQCENCHRGFICRQCNLALGMVKDNTVILNRMINYINANNQEVYV